MTRTPRTEPSCFETSSSRIPTIAKEELARVARAEEERPLEAGLRGARLALAEDPDGEPEPGGREDREHPLADVDGSGLEQRANHDARPHERDGRQGRRLDDRADLRNACVPEHPVEESHGPEGRRAQREQSAKAVERGDAIRRRHGAVEPEEECASVGGGPQAEVSADDKRPTSDCADAEGLRHESFPEVTRNPRFSQ
jgi:hypothetical protein